MLTTRAGRPRALCINSGISSAALFSPNAPLVDSLQAAADFFPRSDQTGQHGDRAHRHPTVLRALYAVIHANHRRPLRRIFGREFVDVGGGDACPQR